MVFGEGLEGWVGMGVGRRRGKGEGEEGAMREVGRREARDGLNIICF